MRSCRTSSRSSRASRRPCVNRFSGFSAMPSGSFRAGGRTLGRCVMNRIIRSVTPSDARAIQKIYAPFVSDDATSFEVAVPDVAEVERRIHEHCESYPWLVLESDGNVLGYAYASAHRTRLAYQWSVEVSVYVDPSAHRRGVARALYTALFEFLRRQRYVNAYAAITLPNPPSVGLHESLGFVPVGVFRQIGFKFGRWHDVAWLHLRLTDGVPDCDPLPPTPLWSDPAIARTLAECAESVRMKD